MSSRYVSREAQDAEQALRDVQARLEGNNFCADCGHPRPEFINLTIGTFICQLCTEIHRDLSNRRIKDIYAGDLTMDDVRRMEMVGNDTANRKFLATWDPSEVPEPDRKDKNSVREFIWLKYDGLFKKKKPAAPPAPPAQVGGYRPEDRYYDDRLHDDRGRGGYRREQELFREAPPQTQDRSRGYWSTRYETTAQRMPPPQPPPMRQRDDYYSRAPPPAPSYPDRYRSVAGPDRFQPPQPTQLVPYGRAIRNARGRYQETGMPYEDYASFNSDERDFGVRRVPSSRSRRAEASQEVYGYSDGDGDVDRLQKKGRSSKSKNKSRRKKASLEEVGNGYYSEEDADVEEEVSRAEKKKASKKSKKSSKAKRKPVVEDDDDEEEEVSEDEEEEEDRDVDLRKSRKQGKRSEKRADRDRDSVVTVDVAEEVGSASGQAAKSEFDLMSEWMGESKDTISSQAAPTAQNNGMPASGAIPTAMQQAYATQVPMMPPPMSVYGGMMPMPGGGFMPMMPSFMPGMGMPGMPPGMPQVPPGMAPPMPPGMMGMAAPPGAPGISPSGQPMQGVMNGMQGLNLNQPVPQSVASAAQPPPPPPVGMPAGPPPGPPPEPPQSS